MTPEEVIAEQNKKIEALTAAIEKITAVPPPVHVKLEDVNAGSVQPSLQDLASGKVIIDFPEKKKVEPKANEILASDRERIAEHIQEIADGRMIVISGYA